MKVVHLIHPGCTTSTLFMLRWVCGSHTQDEYSNMGLKSDLKHLSFIYVEQLCRFCLKKFKLAVAFLTELSKCLFHDRSELSVIPRYLASLTVWSSVPWMLYLWMRGFLLLVSLIISHLSGLNCMNQSLSHIWGLLRSSWRRTWSSLMQIILYTNMSSAKSLVVAEM